MASGHTSVQANYNVSLIVPNAPGSLSGDQLELIVTNVLLLTTNWFTTVVAWPTPVVLDYSSSILYSNYFNGGTWSVAGSQLTAVNSLVGGTNATWVDALGVSDTGMLQDNGIPTTTQGDSWLLPFTPHAGYIYTVEAAVTLLAYPGSWVGVGFAQTIPTNAATSAALNSSSVNGYAWQIDTAGGTQNLQAFQGAAGVGQCVNSNNAYAALPTTITNKVVLDATGSNWTATFYVNGVQAGSTNYTSNPPLSGVGITQNAVSSPGNIQWNYFSLTQVAPSGAAPYVLNPLPPTSVTVGAGASLSIPVTAFSSFVPYGYTWSNMNTAVILGSGTTNTVAPLIANLAVANVPGSWDGNTLALIVTNAYGTNISLVSLTVTNAINLGRTNIVVTMTNNNLYLTWPTDHKGWRLEAQTNTLMVGLSTNWFDVAGASSTNQVVVPVNAANGTVFYRMVYP